MPNKSTPKVLKQTVSQQYKKETISLIKMAKLSSTLHNKEHNMYIQMSQLVTN